MKSKDGIPFYVEVYKQELEHRNAINSRVTFQAGLIVVLLGAAFYMIDPVPAFERLVTEVFFWGLWALGMATVIGAALLVGFAYWSFSARYSLFPDMVKTEEFRQRLWEDRKQFGSVALDPEEEFAAMTLHSLAKAASNNRETNKLKGARLHHGTALMYLAAVFLGLALIPYHMKDREPPTRIIHMTEEQPQQPPPSSGDDGNGSSRQGTTPTTYEPPARPPLEEVKEGEFPQPQSPPPESMPGQKSRGPGTVTIAVSKPLGSG